MIVKEVKKTTDNGTYLVVTTTACFVVKGTPQDLANMITYIISLP